MRLRWMLLGLVMMIPVACSRRRDAGPLSPQEALGTFTLRDEFRIELFASEPLVVDPVEVAFDERGRAYVAEMLDYPDDPVPGQAPRSLVRLVEDRDGDGRADAATVFAEKLLQVTSVLPWDGGVIVTAAPDILYLKDTDGDGKADIRRVLFTGFTTRVSSEGRVTNLRFGVDNWIYVANNGGEGKITSPEHPEAAPVSVLGADFRFRLDRGRFEAESGTTQFGNALDVWGNRFITNNSIHVRHVVLPRRYLGRNLFLPSVEAVHDISDHGSRIFQKSEPQYWRKARTAMRQRRYEELELKRNEAVSGSFTGGAGGNIYLGDTFPAGYYGNLFTGDVACNLVHRDVLEPKGVTFVARRAADETDREFLTSTDPWFRPCNTTTGPDGNLYIVDIYREVIEGPEFIPEELRKDLNLYGGNDRGRIYRIVPRNASPAPFRFDLARLTSMELANLLGHRNAWQRLTAQRLLLQRQDRSVVPHLREMALQGASEEARLHALYALEGLSALDAALVARSLNDPSAGVREHSLRLAEAFPELAKDIAARVSDPAPRVVFQAVFSAGEFPGSATTAALASVAARQASDRWFRAAVLSSKAGSSTDLAAALPADFLRKPDPGKESFVEELSTVVGARHDTAEVVALLKWAKALPAAEPWLAVSLRGLARGLEIGAGERLRSPLAEPLLTSLLGSSSEPVSTGALAVARFFELPGLVSTARRQAVDPALPSSRRAALIRALAAGRLEEVQPVLEKLLEEGPDLGVAAVDALNSFDDPRVAELLLARWRKFGPEVRERALDALLARRRSVTVLLAAVEHGAVETAAFDLPRKEKLLRNPDADIRSQAARIFRDQPSDRAAVVASYRTALDLSGDPGRGRGTFDKNCAKCHISRGGRAVGPDLARVRGKTKLELLEAILDPSRAIDPSFTNYVILTRDGKIHDGLVAVETPGAVTLRRGEEDETILRSNIAEIRASHISLMPDGLEAGMTPQDAADLIAFLQGSNLRPR